MPKAYKSQLRAALLAVTAFSGTSAMAQQSAPQPIAPPPFEQVYKMPVVYSVPGEDKVQVRRDIVYKTVGGPAGSNIELKLDVYTPREAKPGDRFAAVVLISGGGAGDHDW